MSLGGVMASRMTINGVQERVTNLRALPGVFCVTDVMNYMVMVTGGASFNGVDDLAALTASDCT